MAAVKTFRCRSDIWPASLPTSVRAAFSPVLMLNTKSLEGGCCGHPHTMVSQRRGPEQELPPWDFRLLCCNVLWIVFPAPAGAPHWGFLGCPSGGGAFLLSSKNQAPFDRDFLVLVSHTTGFTLLYIWGHLCLHCLAPSYCGLWPVWAELGGEGSVSPTCRLPLRVRFFAPQNVALAFLPQPGNGVRHEGGLSWLLLPLLPCEFWEPPWSGACRVMGFLLSWWQVPARSAFGSQVPPNITRVATCRGGRF